MSGTRKGGQGMRPYPYARLVRVYEERAALKLYLALTERFGGK